MSGLIAGRELDALVAEKVMGFSEVMTHTELKPGKNFMLTEEGVVLDFSFERWLPSTDIAAAWEVVEKIKQPDIRVEIETPFGWPHWACRFYRGPDVLGGSGGETAPLAICRAALAALDTE